MAVWISTCWCETVGPRTSARSPPSPETSARSVLELPPSTASTATAGVMSGGGRGDAPIGDVIEVAQVDERGSVLPQAPNDAVDGARHDGRPWMQEHHGAVTPRQDAIHHAVLHI